MNTTITTITINTINTTPNLARQARQTTVKTRPHTKISMYAFTEELRGLIIIKRIIVKIIIKRIIVKMILFYYQCRHSQRSCGV